MADVGQACAQAPAADTITFKKRDVSTLDNFTVKASSGHTKDKLTLHFITSSDAAIAIDALY